MTRARLPEVFPSLAFLYGPADPSVPVSIQEADRGWHLPDVSGDAELVLWGRIARNARPSLRRLPEALAREAAIVRLRAAPPRGLRLYDLHRLPAVRRPGRIRGPLRTVLLSGALAELARGERPRRVIDEVVRATGAASSGGGLRPSGDGSALATLPMRDGALAELRIARAGHPKAAQRGYAALQALESAGVGRVPRPVARGETAGASWGLETRLPGQHTVRLTPSLLDDIRGSLLELPGSAAPQRAIDDQLAEVRLGFPSHADAIDAASAAAQRWSAGMGSVLVHGDLWLNNVLVADGRLSGIFDWDGWHPAGLPGTDLVNLLAAQERTRSRRDIGDLLIADYWRSAEVRDVLSAYFKARGRPLPDAPGLAAIGVGWWASRVAGSLDRAWRPADQPVWVARNVDAPLERIARLERELG